MAASWWPCRGSRDGSAGMTARSGFRIPPDSCAQHRHHRRHREGQGPVPRPPGAHSGLQHVSAQGGSCRRLAPRGRLPSCTPSTWMPCSESPQHAYHAVLWLMLSQTSPPTCRATRSAWMTCRRMCGHGSRRCVGGWCRRCAAAARFWHMRQACMLCMHADAVLLPPTLLCLQSMRAPAGAAAAKPPVEFDQAISYVNKIKVQCCAVHVGYLWAHLRTEPNGKADKHVYQGSSGGEAEMRWQMGHVRRWLSRAVTSPASHARPPPLAPTRSMPPHSLRLVCLPA